MADIISSSSHSAPDGVSWGGEKNGYISASSPSYFMNKLILAAAFCLSCAPAFCAPQQAYLDYMEGAAYESDGKFSDALSSYRKAIAADPQAEDAYVQALKLDLQSGQVDEAYKFAAELVKMDASSSRYWTFYAAANWAKGDAAEAEKAYEKALKLDPKNTDAIYQVAALLKRAQPEKAVSYLRRYAMLASIMAASTSPRRPAGSTRLVKCASILSELSGSGRAGCWVKYIYMPVPTAI